jgi:hypothetical protein
MEQGTVCHSQYEKQFAVGNLPGAKKERTGFPIAGGVLMIIAGCLLVFYGLIGISGALVNLHKNDFYPLLVTGVSGLIGGFLSLGGGAAALKRTFWMFATVSAALALSVEAVHLYSYGLMSPHGNIIAGVFVTVPVIAISLLGLILVASSKAQFSIASGTSQRRL